MNLFGIMSITGAGLSAERTRLNVVASNIANARVTRTPEGGPYRRRDVLLSAPATDFSRTLSQELSGPSKAEIVIDKSQPRMVYDPGHPDADQNGYVAMPNVNVVEEMADMLTSSRSFEANTSVLGALKNMALHALRIGKE
ncbi:MAG: flagellar basal body rod protein FlgC [Deltaproteobacteria bacterium]|nr:flagellar basal body rod protein FlgC [Deltaproteobacteria bacterium]